MQCTRLFVEKYTYICEGVMVLQDILLHYTKKDANYNFFLLAIEKLGGAWGQG